MADARKPSAGDSSPSDARKLADLQTVLEVSRQMGGNSELPELLTAIQQASLRVFDCERTTIFLYDRQTNELYSRLATAQEEIRFPANRGIAGEAFHSERVVNVPDPYADPRFNQDIDRRTGFRTRNILTCPLIGLEGKPVGVIQALNKRSGPFDTWDEELVRTLGAQAGVALQRQMLLDEFMENQRIKRDLHIARGIQQGLLPRRPPVLMGYDVAGWNQPADETGGDFYDFQLLNSGAFAVTIADVTGHGIGPALIASECRALLRASLSLTQNLERVLALVNELLHYDLPSDRFVTAFVGLLEPDEHRFTYISAGQGPLLQYRAATNAASELDTSGLPLGVLPERSYELSRPIIFERGDMLVFLTDGFIEWPDPDRKRFGLQNVLPLLETHHALPAAGLIRAICEGASKFARGVPQQDDLTAVVIKRL